MRMAARLEEGLIKGLHWIMAGLTLLVLIGIIWHIVSNGISSINLSFLLEAPRQMGKEGGILPAILGTVYLTIVSLGIAIPLGVGTAIYLTEYVASERLVSVIRFGTESLAAVPSIIFGLFGFVLFVLTWGLGWSVLSGGLTLALMILPTLIRASEEAIKMVPVSYREGSLALGANKWYTIRKVVLPAAIPGIAAGVVLGIGRAVGETAAVLLTAGSALGMPLSIFDPARTLSVHLYVLASEGISLEKAYASATVLVILVLIINLISGRLMTRLTGQTEV
ncbi:MAG: phosphate ABC transporter permease PstA [Bacillota bacterium]|jgi:phosphate transport system permease protein